MVAMVTPVEAPPPPQPLSPPPPLLGDQGRVLPTLSDFKTIRSVVEFLHQPPKGEEGLSIVDREWRWKDVGLQSRDRKWRSKNEDATKRIFEYKRAYESLQARQQEDQSVDLSDFDVADILDAERVAVGLEVSGWIKREVAMAAEASRLTTDNIWVARKRQKEQQLREKAIDQRRARGENEKHRL